MTANENNSKYVAEAWINDGKDQEFKESFLQNLLQQLQGHKDDDTGLNADRVDGYHYYDIHEEIVNSTINLLSEIKIGDIYFNKEHTESYLPFDSIHLNVEGHDYQIDDEKEKLEWAVDEGKLDVSVSLNKVFAKLYDMLEQEIRDSYKRAEYEELYENILEPLSEFKETLDNSGAINNKGQINAASVNGISFYVKTLEEYNRLKNGTEEERAIINDPKNVFIIREPYQPGETADDFLLAKQPDTAVISKYYEFRIGDVNETEVDEETGQEVTIVRKWLQYKHVDGTTWNNMVPTEDLLDNDTVLQLLISVLENKDSYYNIHLSTKILDSSLSDFPITDNSDYPLVDYIKSTGIRGLTSSYAGVNLTPTEKKENNKLVGKYINLDSLTNKIEQIIDNKINAKINAIYPIGCVYITVKNINPRSFLGVGTWDKIEDRFLLGSGPSYPATYDANGFANKVDGEANHTLNVQEMPSHNHTQAAHSHTPTGGYHFLVTKSDEQGKIPDWKEYGIKQSVLDNSVSKPWVMLHNSTTLNAYVSEPGNTAESAPSINPNGGTQPHNNMPPYLVVHIWRRTA